MILQAVALNNNLTILKLSDVLVFKEESNYDILISYLEQTRNLKMLELRQNNVTDSVIKSMIPAFSKATKLSHLDLSQNSLTENSLPALMDYLTISNLNCLSVAKNNISFTESSFKYVQVGLSQSNLNHF